MDNSALRVHDLEHRASRVVERGDDPTIEREGERFGVGVDLEI